MQGNNVAFLIKSVQIHVLCVFCHFLGRIQIKRKQPAAKAFQMLQHGAADFAGTDNSHGGIGNFHADFTGQCIILHIRAHHNGFHFPAAHQHQHDGVIGYTVGRIGGIANGNTQFARCPSVHMVKTNGTGGNAFYAAFLPDSQNFFVHRGGNNADGIVAFCQSCILRCGFVPHRSILNLHFPAPFFKKSFFVKLS